MALKPAIFLDKDGTLVRDIPFNVDPSRMRLLPDAAASLRRLKEAGFLLVVVSNQPGVAFGFYNEDKVRLAFRHLYTLLAAEGVILDAYCYCPHHPDADMPEYRERCACRKPASGMLVSAAERFGVGLTSSWMIGDILDDIEAGNRAGCKSILLLNGGETEWRPGKHRRPFRQVRSLAQAADIVLANMGGLASGYRPSLEGVYKPALYQAR